ncbi:MAG: DoxX family protein [Bacteroidota bacterium]
MSQEKKVDISLLLFRLYVGFAMFYGHGLRKFNKLIGDEDITFADPFGIGPAPSLALAVFAEVFCSFLIVLGLFTRLATIPLIITMLVAWLMVHSGDPFGDQELPVFYLVSYIVIFLQGSGWYSLDALMNRKQK